LISLLVPARLPARRVREVKVARRPSVFVRPLSMDEGRKLQKITRSAKDPVRLRRAIVVMMSAQGQAVRDITSLLQVSEDYVRDVIHAFNERGFDALDPKWSGGPRRKIGDRIREWICLIARTATYTRTDGVMHMLAALDLATGKLYYRIRPRKRWLEFLDLLKALRARWPGEKLYVVCDNFSPHRHARVQAWCADNDVELVFTPTYGSWLNWIEAEFAALRYFALNGTDHRSHAEQNAAIAGYVRWHNIRARPKVNFATDSPIRTWTDYPAKAA
jgi:transposase